MDLIEEWALMGPQTQNFEKWGKTLTSVFKDKPFPLPDYQSALIYLLFTDKKRWGDKTYPESEYYLNSYWEATVKMYDNLTGSYTEMEMNDKVLRTRHAEKVKGLEAWESKKYRKGRERGPFVTHFTGCQPLEDIKTDLMQDCGTIKVCYLSSS
ncbi:hypothetical protein M0R45_004713 [Rubus argutus]|uniref:Uncharacterized protein n=1 Tax=Rubus argutus TaxID=59490 RepID=A0AAW1YKR1_RUBAR